MSFSKVLALCLFLMSFYLTGCTSDNTTSSTEKYFILALLPMVLKWAILV